MRNVGTFSWPAPSMGWRTSGNLAEAPLAACERLDNVFPTAEGGEVRRGHVKHATIDDPGVRFMSYASGDNTELFAATETDIYPIESPADADVAPTALRTSQTSGDWSAVQMSTAGGEFLVAVNGADTGFQYNGAIDTDLSITGVASSDLTQVWSFKERLFFVEKDTQKAWYLPVESIGGTVNEINLGSVFKKGGSLLFGATWSLDSGDGLDDKCVFVSDRGEIAVYGGIDPSSAATWSLEGVYQVGSPIDKHSSFQLGGELMIVTDDGIFPISQAVSRSYSELFQAAMTEPIEDAWKDAVARRSSADPVGSTYWASEGKLIVSVPEQEGGLPVQYVANTRYGTWCRYVGWDVKAATVHNDSLYFADGNGVVFQGETGGTDNDRAYTAYYVPKFSTLGTAGKKIVNFIGLVYRSPEKLTFAVKALKDYERKTLPVPAATAAPTDSSTWGSAVWGTSTWGGEAAREGRTQWKAAGATGFSVAPAISVTVNQTEPPGIEFISPIVRYEVGSPL